jgi:hypothetical protein
MDSFPVDGGTTTFTSTNSWSQMVSRVGPGNATTLLIEVNGSNPLEVTWTQTITPPPATGAPFIPVPAPDSGSAIRTLTIPVNIAPGGVAWGKSQTINSAANVPSAILLP